MSPSWSDELRIGLCPDRLVVARRRRAPRSAVSREIVPCAGDPVSALKGLAGGSATTVIVSNHFVRYMVLHGSSALKSERDWDAYARHAYANTFGADAARWQIRSSASGATNTRVACAIDAALVEGLRALPRLRSLQPYLMTAFNARRRAIGRGSVWLVLQEPQRLTVALIEDAHWTLVRTRQAAKEWQRELTDLLDREAAICDAPACTRAVLCAEDEAPPRLGQYDITDASLPPDASLELRPHVMTLH